MSHESHELHCSSCSPLYLRSYCTIRNTDTLIDDRIAPHQSLYEMFCAVLNPHLIHYHIITYDTEGSPPSNSDDKESASDNDSNSDSSNSVRKKYKKNESEKKSEKSSKHKKEKKEKKEKDKKEGKKKKSKKEHKVSG